MSTYEHQPEAREVYYMQKASMWFKSRPRLNFSKAEHID